MQVISSSVIQRPSFSGQKTFLLKELNSLDEPKKLNFPSFNIHPLSNSYVLDALACR